MNVCRGPVAACGLRRGVKGLHHYRGQKFKLISSPEQLVHVCTKSSMINLTFPNTTSNPKRTEPDEVTTINYGATLPTLCLSPIHFFHAQSHNGTICLNRPSPNHLKTLSTRAYYQIHNLHDYPQPPVKVLWWNTTEGNQPSTK